MLDFFVFKDNTSPKILLSYAASIRLGIIEFKVPNKAPSKALDTITHAKKHVTFSTPLHSYVHKQTHSKSQHNNLPLKAAVKLNSFQDHYFPDYSSKTKSFQDHFLQEPSFQQFSSKKSHSKTICHHNHHTHSVLQKMNHFWTIPIQNTSSCDCFSQNQLFQDHLPQKVSSQHQSSKNQSFQYHFTTDNVCDIIALKQAFPQSFDWVGNLLGTYTIHPHRSIYTTSTVCPLQSPNRI